MSEAIAVRIPTHGWNSDRLFDSDPLKNIVLFIHLYGFWRTDDQ